ncbi:GSCOCG00006053001-RA-CDS [Cotesia congregata]|nr:GSCOCG00006053001-RA-CDS [Cotesia congregata]
MWREIILSCLVLANVVESKIIINDHKPEDSSERLRRDARELVQTCFTNNSNPVMISEDLFDNNWDPVRNSLIVIDRGFNKQITGFLSTYPTYVLPFESIDNLKPVIDNLQRSQFWNIKSPFLMVGKELGCLNARKVLEFMWNHDLLSVYYLCNIQNSTMVFTLNPYARYAPAPWKLIDKFDESDKKLILFTLKYTKGPKICNSIVFNKTDYLENAEIRFIDFNEDKSYSEEENREFAKSIVKNGLKTPYINLYKISASINATPTLEFISVEPQRSYAHEFADSRYDIYNRPELIDVTDYEYVDVILDYTTDKTFSIVTKKTDSLIRISEITNNVQFMIGSSLILIMFAMLMVIINRDDVCLAVMDMMRLITGIALETPLNRLAMKLVFFFGFLFAFLIVPDFLGEMLSILSKPSKHNVETLRDLYERKFHVYYWESLKSDLMNEQLWITDEDKKYVHPVPYWAMQDCLFNVQKNSTIACLHETQFLLFESDRRNGLYISTETSFKKQSVYWIRKNWPLKSKFDKMMLTALEPALGYTTFLKKNYIDKIVKKRVKKKRIEESEKYDQFDYDNLIFSYYFIGFLAALGIVIFGIEVILVRYFEINRLF